MAQPVASHFVPWEESRGNWGKVPCLRTQHIGRSGTWTLNLWNLSPVLHPLCATYAHNVAPRVWHSWYRGEKCYSIWEYATQLWKCVALLCPRLIHWSVWCWTYHILTVLEYGLDQLVELNSKQRITGGILSSSPGLDLMKTTNRRW